MTDDTADRFGIPYTPPGYSPADALAALPQRTRKALEAMPRTHGTRVEIPGVAGLFAARVDDDGSVYLWPVLAFRPDGTHARNAVDLRQHYGPGAVTVPAVEIDPAAVMVEGITQGNAGYRVNGATYTADLTLKRWPHVDGWVVSGSTWERSLTDAARKRLSDWANGGAADAIATPARVAAVRAQRAASALEDVARQRARLEAAFAVAAAGVTAAADAWRTAAGAR